MLNSFATHNCQLLDEELIFIPNQDYNPLTINTNIFFTANVLEFVHIFKEKTLLIYKSALAGRNILFLGFDAKVAKLCQ